MFPFISFCLLYDLFCSCVLQQQLPPAVVNFLSSLYQNEKKASNYPIVETPHPQPPNSQPPQTKNTHPQKNSQPTSSSFPISIAWKRQQPTEQPKRAGGLGLLMSERWDLKLMTSLIFLLAELQGGWGFVLVSIEGVLLVWGKGRG